MLTNGEQYEVDISALNSRFPTFLDVFRVRSVTFDNTNLSLLDVRLDGGVRLECGWRTEKEGDMNIFSYKRTIMRLCCGT